MKTFADFNIDIKTHSSGEVKTQCPTCSPQRKKKNYPCLNVNLDKGVWNCWHCGWRGGLKEGQLEAPRITKVWTKPNYVEQISGLSKSVIDYFTERGITESVLKRNQIANGKIYFPQVEEERGCILFPYLRGSEVINIKYRSRDKLFRMAAGAERILYGLNDVEPVTIWVEGEIDKLSMEVAGFKNCVSVPDGAPAPETKNYESKFNFLDAEELNDVTTHIISVDNDLPGRKLQDELTRRLGVEKCLIVSWPDGCKDANDALVKYGVELLSDAIKNAQPLPIAGAYMVSDYAQALTDLYENGIPRGVSTGWQSVDEFYTVRQREVTVVTGIPNSGKSEWLDALFINLANAYNWTFGVFSAENTNIEHIAKLAEKYIGKPFNPGFHERINATEWDRAQTWINRYFIFIEPQEPSLNSILEVAKRLVLRNGILGLIIDPWNEIEHNRPEMMSETEYIGQSLASIRRFAVNHGVHVWVVAHPHMLRKEKDGNYPVPNPYMISGSSNWRNKADNCLSVWRELDPSKITREVEIHVQKIRHKVVGKLGMAKLDYDRVTGIYREIA